MNINECGCRPYGWLGLDGNRCIRVIPRQHEELKDQSLEQNNDGFTNNLYLCSDIVEESDVGNIKMPVLRSLKRKNGIPVEINNVVWLRVKRPSISRIRLYIADDR